MTKIIEPQSVLVTADRHEVPSGAHWDDESGSDFFFRPDAAEIAAGNKETLADFGWITTGLAFVAGSGADFMTSVDKGIPAHFVLSPAADLIQSPYLFGSYTHAEAAQHHLGSFPVTFTMEAWMNFAVASASETESGLGFTVAGGSIITAADAIAVIHSNGTNFICRSSVDADTGAVIDNAWHLWKFVFRLGTTDKIEWFIDNVSQGTLNLREDVFPMSWGAANVGSGTNRLNVGPARLYYR